jgi:hypothetical protein
LVAVVPSAGEGEWLRAGLLAGMGLYGIWWAFPRNGAEAAQVRFRSDDAIEHFQRVASADERRRSCRCCGYPTLAEGSTSECFLCEWDPEEGLRLREARENLARYGSVYPPEQRSEWSHTPRSAAEQDAARALIRAYDEYRAAASRDDHELWLAVLDAEAALERSHERRVRELS